MRLHPGPLPFLDGRQACGDADPELFFNPEGERGSARDRRDERAKAVCLACPLRRPCLAWALERGEWGVWGGLTEDEREALQRTHGLPVRVRSTAGLRSPNLSTPSHIDDTED